MVVLVDTNIIIDYYCEREEFYKASKAVMTWCGEDGVNGYVAFHSLSNIWFILRKSPEKIRREILLNICKVLTVAGADQEEVVKAIENSDFKDFEDCLQDRCAVSVAADYIVTRNVKDFATAETKAITPKEFCELMENAKAKHNSEYMEMLDRGFKEIDSGSRGTTKTMDELRAMEHE